MKIVQISTGYDISANGGITNYVRNLSTKLIDDGHEVFVIYSQNDGTEKNYAFKCIPVNSILYPFHRSSVIYNDDVRKLEKIIQQLKPDIIHVHMMIDLPVDVLKMFNEQAKLVISLHDYSFICNRITLIRKSGEICVDSNKNIACNHCIEKFETVSNRVWRKLLMMTKDYVYHDKIMPSNGHHVRFMRCKQLFKNADALIAVSSRVKEIYEENGFSNHNFIVNHIGNYTAEDAFRAHFLNKKLLTKGEKIKFGFIGSLRRIKGADIFLEIAENSHHEFHIYGNIDEEYIEKIKLYKNIIFHGEYKHTQLLEILKNIHIGLVLPIWEDNAPQVVFEFINSNIPVIGTKMGGIPDFINEKNGTLFSPEKGEISKIISYINSDGIYDFYNKKINKFEGTKLPEQHSTEMIKLYNSL